MELNSELNLLKKTVFLSERELEEYQLRTEDCHYEVKNANNKSNKHDCGFQEPAQTWCLPLDNMGRTTGGGEGGGGCPDVLTVRKKHKRIRLNVGGDVTSYLYH